MYVVTLGVLLLFVGLCVCQIQLKCDRVLTKTSSLGEEGNGMYLIVVLGGS